MTAIIKTWQEMAEPEGKQVRELIGHERCYDEEADAWYDVPIYRVRWETTKERTCGNLRACPAKVSTREVELPGRIRMGTRAGVHRG